MMNRRRFLIVFITLTISGAAFLVLVRNKFYNFRGLIGRFINPRLDENSSLGTLSEEEMKMICALSEVLTPLVESSGTKNEFMRNYVNYKTSNVKGYLKEYINGVKLLKETSKKVVSRDRKFYELNLPERDNVLRSILWEYGSEDGVMRRLERIFISRRKLAFRDFVVSDIIVASVKEPHVGWSIVGYSHYPGVPAARPRDYTGQPQFSPR